MSVDTRTSGFDDQPALSMVKVPCDPAQVIVNHASFRVRLAPSPSARSKPANAPGRVPVLGGAAVAAAAGAGRRRAPVVWSGKSAPGDTAAMGGLLQAVREHGRGHEEFDGGATQTIPRVDLAHDLAEDTLATPTVIGQRTYGDPDETRPLTPVRDHPHDPRYAGGGGPYDGLGGGSAADARRAPADTRGQASYYPGRRMNLGVVLLPLRVFLGFICIYAGMGKLCDPVYFDGGERGSMVTWLRTLHPWALAEPLRDFALAHPVGAGLSVAFLQVIVGVLTVLGLWQRFAACIGALLSAALLMTVSWKTVPAYDAPDIIYLAAWSPLIIAGAPVYSLDGRLAGEAWRTLGPRSEIWRLRRRVLRRGTIMATLVCGLTLLIGSLLGGAVRSTTVVTVPGPGQAPSNYLPGSPLPQPPSGKQQRPQQQPTGQQPSKAAEPTASASAPAAKSSRGNTGSTAKQSAGTGSQSPTATRGSGSSSNSGVPPKQSTPKPPSSSSGSGGGSGGGDTAPKKPGLVGGLLG
ncbi:putative membrane protein YphA (DoxX/SURF4 family) [Streptomyces sp. 2132.2]|uniref:DoxX family protein n=1 Tax=Streptomyces sp. 2132.2 TaxID=2485161 RepID=UPI000FB4A380|nr:DoxX family protein [Streptomyces sp. 2132.2]ROQ97297.1 putative membrane protein YphA (DoxX/SURF4 family) [Streptomyces sp. 2132.2]